MAEPLFHTRLHYDRAPTASLLPHLEEELQLLIASSLGSHHFYDLGLNASLTWRGAPAPHRREEPGEVAPGAFPSFSSPPFFFFFSFPS